MKARGQMRSSRGSDAMKVKGCAWLEDLAEGHLPSFFYRLRENFLERHSETGERVTDAFKYFFIPLSGEGERAS